MKKLRMEDLRVETFSTERPIQLRGTVHAEESVVGCTGGGITDCMDTCDPTNPCGSCDPQTNGSCAYTCTNNYGCSTQDQRCTYGAVYVC